jgi:hypothetical protein
MHLHALAAGGAWHRTCEQGNVWNANWLAPFSFQTFASLNNLAGLRARFSFAQKPSNVVRS